MSNKIQTIWVTKYALAQGIFSIRAEVGERYARELTKNYTSSLSRSEFALTPEDAIIKAEEMRIKKLKSLDRQIKKISALNFESMVDDG